MVSSVEKIILNILIREISQLEYTDNNDLKNKTMIIKSLSYVLKNIVFFKKSIKYKDHMLEQNIQKIIDDYLKK